MPPKLKATKLPHLNNIVIKQEGGKFFYTTRDSIIIDIYGLSQILKFLVFSGILSEKVLEGILQEYDDYKSEV